MSDALRDGVERFLAGLRTERQLSPHTADGYGRDASEAVQVGLQLLEQVKASA